jgi:2-polyprenyl-3-methyl-5-hydroxy-6-metoxy-1,4-benzoquinol methylase
MASVQYWNDRAARFARHSGGLAAVCAYGMPGFYNACIDMTQRLALRRWLHVAPDEEVLDVGCGVGRWSIELARRGARVTGVDLSDTMLAEARRRAGAAGVAHRCDFRQQDVSALDTGQRYSFVLGVTVLQHVLETARLAESVRRLALHLKPAGRMVLLEVAPNGLNDRCNTASFLARTRDDYLALFRGNGLVLEQLTGVDPAPLRIMFLPYYRRLPKPLAVAGLGVATALCLPVDAALGRRFVGASWHKVFVLRKPPITHAYGARA